MADTQAPPRALPAGRTRQVVILLLFAVTTVNSMDRNLLGVLKPTIRSTLHFGEGDYGDIVFAFGIAYAAGDVGMCAFTDKGGMRIGLAVALTNPG